MRHTRFLFAAAAMSVALSCATYDTASAAGWFRGGCGSGGCRSGGYSYSGGYGHSGGYGGGCASGSCQANFGAYGSAGHSGGYCGGYGGGCASGSCQANFGAYGSAGPSKGYVQRGIQGGGQYHGQQRYAQQSPRLGRQGFAQQRQGFAQQGNVRQGQGISGRAGLGVRLASRDNAIWIEKVYPDSPAEQAGLQAGDKLVNVNGGEPQGDFRQIASQIRQMNPEQDLQLTVMRDGEEQQIDAQLTSWTEVFDSRSQNFNGQAPRTSQRPQDSQRRFDGNRQAAPPQPGQPNLAPQGNAEIAEPPASPEAGANADEPSGTPASAAKQNATGGATPRNSGDNN